MTNLNNNSDILFIYDAKLTNPNGDPDESNRPRMDYARDINIVSDGRIKRYIRDYAQIKGHDIFVTGVDGKPVTAEKRVTALKDASEEWTLDNWIDVRLFGAIMTIKGDNRSYTGPVQFNWGYSLNEVEIFTSSITSHFASSESKTQGSIGKDHRVLYSLIAFNGVVNANRAEHTKMTEKDIGFLDEAIVRSIPLLATRSKVGQTPRLYIRVEYKDKLTTLGDLREHIELVTHKDEVRNIKECSLEIGSLIKVLADNKEKINKIIVHVDINLNLLVDGSKVDLKEVIDHNIEIIK